MPIAALVSLRPKQWVKNLFIFAPLVFSMGLMDVTKLIAVAKAFVTFCLISSCVYLINDIVDRENDRQHPVKCNRPIASGALPMPATLIMIGILLPTALIAAAMQDRALLIIVVAYMVNNLLYSFRVKQIVLVDVGSIAAGFVMRVLAGTVVIDVEASPWLIMCTILLALFLGFAKRRHEIVLLEDDQTKHRAVLGEYSEKLLDQLILVSASCTLMSYALYTVSEKAIGSFGSTNLIYTFPFVLYGLFRYLYLIHKRHSGGNPTLVMFTDVPLIINVLLWLGTCVAIIYGGR